MFERFDYSLDSKHFVNKIPCLTSLSLTVKKKRSIKCGPTFSLNVIETYSCRAYCDNT